MNDRMRIGARFGACLVALVGVGGFASQPSVPAGSAQPSAQKPRGQRPSRPQLWSGVDVVAVTVTVNDAQGRLVRGLERDDFVVFEDGTEQPITQFIGSRVPVSVGLLLDISESMVGERMVDANLALTRFTRDLLVAEDEAFLVGFNHRPRVLVPWTSPPAGLERGLEGVVPSGGTAIYDAVVEALPQLEKRKHARVALVVVSDGADTASDTDVKTLRAELRRADAFVYAIAIDAPGRQRAASRVNPYTLRQITDDSGGYTEVIQKSADLDGATARISEELNSQYVLGYESPRGADGAYHTIRVRAKDMTLRVRSRRGYIATDK